MFTSCVQGKCRALKLLLFLSTGFRPIMGNYVIANVVGRSHGENISTAKTLQHELCISLKSLSSFYKIGTDWHLVRKSLMLYTGGCLEMKLHHYVRGLRKRWRSCNDLRALRRVCIKTLYTELFFCKSLNK